MSQGWRWSGVSPDDATDRAAAVGQGVGPEGRGWVPVNDIRPGDHVLDPSNRAGVVTDHDGDLHVWVADPGKPGVERSVLTSRLRRTTGGGRRG